MAMMHEGVAQALVEFLKELTRLAKNANLDLETERLKNSNKAHQDKK